MKESASFEFPSLRSILFTPGDRMDRFGKAMASNADALLLDWEDGVSLDAKEAARLETLCFLKSGNRRMPVGLRINRPSTQDGQQDLCALAQCDVMPDFIAFPKVESAKEALSATAMLGARASTPSVAFIESALGIERLGEIAVLPGLVALALGGVDLAADLGASFCWDALVYSRGRIVQAAALGGIAAWDVPYLATKDEAGLTGEAKRVRAMGFKAKLAIHPAQTDLINAAFSPDQAEVEQARRILAADAAAQGRPCVVDGKLVDPPVVKLARRTMAFQERNSSTGSGTGGGSA